MIAGYCSYVSLQYYFYDVYLAISLDQSPVPADGSSQLLTCSISMYLLVYW